MTGFQSGALPRLVRAKPVDSPALGGGKHRGQPSRIDRAQSKVYGFAG